jgi:hypothetical protein
MLCAKHSRNRAESQAPNLEFKLRHDPFVRAIASLIAINGMDAPASAGTSVPEWLPGSHPSRGESTMRVATIGIDLVKKCIPGPRRRLPRSRRAAQAAETHPTTSLLRKSPSLPDWHGILLRIVLLRPSP